MASLIPQLLIFLLFLAGHARRLGHRRASSKFQVQDSHASQMRQYRLSKSFSKYYSGKIIPRGTACPTAPNHKAETQDFAAFGIFLAM